MRSTAILTVLAGSACLLACGPAGGDARDDGATPAADVARRDDAAAAARDAGLTPDAPDVFDRGDGGATDAHAAPDTASCPADDPLDAEGRDDNCDGYDGVVAETLYVAPGGGARGGSPDFPLGSLRAAADLLRELPALRVRAVVVAREVREADGLGELLARGLHVAGGYDAADGWRARAGASELRVRDPAGVRVERAASGGASGGVLDRVTLRGADATASMRHAVVLTLVRTGPGFTLRDVTLVGGDGRGDAHGTSGAAGASGVHGQSGGAVASLDALSLPPLARSAGGHVECAGTTGDGGGGGATNPAGGLSDADVRAGHLDGLPGGGGARGGSGWPLAFVAPLAPLDGARGAPGAHGRHGDVATVSIGGVTRPGNTPAWTVAAGLAARGGAPGDGSAGTPGQGGGGGGAIVGTCASGAESTTLTAIAGGGAGGSGGCGGGAGRAGAHGGHAVALVVSGPLPRFERVRITRGHGGAGGAGGRGGDGGNGALGGLATSPGTAAGCMGGATPRLSGGGGFGGTGGGGGGGAGGDGGWSIGVLTDEPAATTLPAGLSVESGGAGARGEGGAHGTLATRAPDGARGETRALYVLDTP